MYTKQQIEILEGENISTQSLNKGLYRLYDNLVNTSFVTTSAPIATDAISGTIMFTDSISATGALKAASPYTLNNIPIFLNSYFNTDISSTVTYNNTSISYIELMNNVLLVFGKINTGADSFTINLKELFDLTPYTISEVLYVNIGGSQNSNTSSPCSIINSITNNLITVNSLSFTSAKIPGLPRNIDLCMLIKVI